VNTAPATASTNEDTAKVFSAGGPGEISVSDVDLGSNALQVTLTATNGTITLASLTGLSFSFSDGNGASAGDGTADTTMTFRGSLADVNAALDGLAYSPNANFNGSASLTITSNDRGFTGSGGAKTDTDVVAITVDAVNDAPVNTAPATASTNEDTAKVFSAGGPGEISVSDVDLGSNALQVTLTATNGTITLASLTGLSFSFSDGNGASAGDGTADTTMTFR